MTAKNPLVDEFMSHLTDWQKELKKLRAILLNTQLKEDFKWRQPCYTFENHNVVILGTLKEYCVLRFLKGSLIQDSANVLESPGPNTQAARQMKFKNVSEIQQMKGLILEYVASAIALETSGVQVQFQKELPTYPDELLLAFEKSSRLKTRFESLTPGRKRGYLIFFLGTKNSSTRNSRIEKFVPRILKGMGMNDCICGLSKKPPQCDGSHNLKNSR